ncbi:TSC22 domain family protein 1-like [Mugil cephalus]|uniref:TSC22 domain family protein 1-like n=1 Tax=Mugil cephalus TaxID=48193 RepID=UPI001FB60244|nr:TSC22 domain family protein 1-like [Mugil cephalus]
MHHQEFSGDPSGTGSRKTAFHFRRGSSGASAASSSSSAGGGAAEDHPTQAGSSSPGLHHQPLSQAAGVKKKSGFQITSVTSAQNVSGNNSLADDTESYDDMDESHTEDLSSSDMLDVSVSRATDTGVPERSSSDETLNSLHGVDTPGLVSPNEPLQPHSIPQGAQQHVGLVNGTAHHQVHHRHSDSLGGGEPTLAVAPLSSSSPAAGSRAGPSQPQRLPAADKPAGGSSQHAAPGALGGAAPDPHGQGGGNILSASAAAPPPGPAGVDSANASGQAASVGGGTGSPAAAPGAQIHHTQAQAATGSRFRVVKLDTNSEPFRKGRWTCTEYYEKEVPPPPATEAPKAAEPAAEAEAGVNPPGVPAAQPPHTLQAYQLPSQDFTSPQAAQSPPQGPAQASPPTYVSPQEIVAQMPAAPVPPRGAAGGPAEGGGSPAVPGPVRWASGRQLRRLQAVPAVRLFTSQPTAPFQTQVPHPQMPHQGHVPQPAQAAFAAGQHPAAAHGAPYMPLTALQADLQPLLTPGTSFDHVMKMSHLEDAGKLFLQHQGLLSLPRLGAEGSSGAHAGMSAEASAFMAAAAGLRTQHGEGEDDSSSGASVVAIDNKIEQAMDLVKSHLMYAVREEVEVLKEQIKELIERNTQLEQENNLLKTLASPEQMAQFQAQVQTGGSPTGAAQPPLPAGAAQPPPSAQNSGTSA